MKHDAMLSLRLPSEVKEALARAAQEDMRPISQMALKLLVEGLTRSGHLREPQVNPPSRPGGDRP